MMCRKLLYLATVGLMLMTLVACSQVGSFEKYKEIKKGELMSYVNGLEANDYTNSNWGKIEQIAMTGKNDIDVALNKVAVNNVFRDAIESINEIEKVSDLKMVYSLQQAYDEKLLTIDDLKSIANYLNNCTESPVTLSNRMAQAIKESAAEHMRNNESIIEANADDFIILKYFGTYNDCVAVILNDPYHECPMAIIDFWVTVADVSFHYVGCWTISIWKF